MILLYHHVNPPEEIPSDAGRRFAEGWDFTTSPETLEAHLAYLKKRGKAMVPLSEYVQTLKKTGVPHPESVALTFDDGWKDNLAHALPVLTAAGVSATFFLVTGSVAGIEPESFAGADGIRELLAAGMEIGAHSRTHRGLAGIPLEEARREILGSRDDLEMRFGVKVRHFAYPGGNFNAAVARIVREDAKLDSACGVLGGMRNDSGKRYWLSRETPAEPWGRRAQARLINPVVRTWIGLRSARRLEKILGEGDANPPRN